MTKDDYFNRHLPHRVNLLTTFRERFGPSAPLGGRPKIDPQQMRDLFRCSKDIAMLMVRFFCETVDLKLIQKGRGKGARTYVGNSKSTLRYNIQRFEEKRAREDPRYPKLLAAMKAANRAVAHIVDDDVDHEIRTAEDERGLCDVITWVEEMIETHIYEPNDDRCLKTAMAMADNVMTPPGWK